MNENGGYTIYCARCGEEMNSNSRYCMKCGYLNPEHEANQSMQQYIKNQTNTYSVGGGSTIPQNEITQQSAIGLAYNAGNRVICFVTNLLVFLGLNFILGFLAFQMNPTELNTIVYSFYPITCMILSVGFLWHYSLQLLFMKCNQRWWKAWIPFYNFVVLGNLAFRSKSIGWIALIPGVGIIFLLIVFYRLGKEFQYNGILCLLLPIVFIPLIGYGTHFYGNNQYVSSTDSKVVERNYRLQKILYRLFVVFFLVGLVLFIIANMTSVKATSRYVQNYYYVYASKKLVKEVDSMVSNNQVVCNNREFSLTTGMYYFYFADIRDEIYLPLYYLREPISAFVIADRNGEVPRYYVSMTDGTYGFASTLVEEITYTTPIEYPSIGIDLNAPNVCYLNK